MKIKLLSIIKYFACCISFLSLFPFVALFDGELSYYYSNKSCFLQLLLIVFWGFSGYLFSFLFQYKRRKSPVRINLLFILTIILPLSVTYILLGNEDPALGILIAVLAVVSYCIGRSLFYKSYAKIMSNSLFITVIIFNMVSIFILYLTKCPYNIGLFIGVFICIASMYGIIINQSNIDFLMSRRQHKMENLPQKIRLYNIKLMTIVFAVILVCFFLRDWIVALLYGILNVLHIVISFILYCIQKLFSIFFNTNLIPEKISNGNYQPPQPHKEDYFWLRVIILIAIFIVIIIVNRKQIRRFIIYVMRKLLHFLKQSHIFNRPNNQNEYYYDNEEFIRPEEIKSINNVKENIKQWRKSCKNFYRMDNTAEKYRFGYNLIINGLKFSGFTIIQSDTTIEILDMSKNIIAAGNYSLVTEEYNSIRYGNNFESIKFENLYEAVQSAGSLIGVNIKIK